MFTRNEREKNGFSSLALDVLKEENIDHDDDEQEVPGNVEDHYGEPPSKKAKKMTNSTFNERFGVSSIEFH